MRYIKEKKEPKIPIQVDLFLKAESNRNKTLGFDLKTKLAWAVRDNLIHVWNLETNKSKDIFKVGDRDDEDETSYSMVCVFTQNSSSSIDLLALSVGGKIRYWKGLTSFGYLDCQLPIPNKENCAFLRPCVVQGEITEFLVGTIEGNCYFIPTPARLFSRKPLSPTALSSLVKPIPRLLPGPGLTGKFASFLWTPTKQPNVLRVAVRSVAQENDTLQIAVLTPKSLEIYRFDSFKNLINPQYFDIEKIMNSIVGKPCHILDLVMTQDGFAILVQVDGQFSFHFFEENFKYKDQFVDIYVTNSPTEDLFTHTAEFVRKHDPEGFSCIPELSIGYLGNDASGSIFFDLEENRLHLVPPEEQSHDITNNMDMDASYLGSTSSLFHDTPVLPSPSRLDSTTKTFNNNNSSMFISPIAKKTQPRQSKNLPSQYNPLFGQQTKTTTSLPKSRSQISNDKVNIPEISLILRHRLNNRKAEIERIYANADDAEFLYKTLKINLALSLRSFDIHGSGTSADGQNALKQLTRVVSNALDYFEPSGANIIQLKKILELPTLCREFERVAGWLIPFLTDTRTLIDFCKSTSSSPKEAQEKLTTLLKGYFGTMPNDASIVMKEIIDRANPIIETTNGESELSLTLPEIEKLVSSLYEEGLCIVQKRYFLTFLELPEIQHWIKTSQGKIDGLDFEDCNIFSLCVEISKLQELPNFDLVVSCCIFDNVCKTIHDSIDSFFRSHFEANELTKEDETRIIHQMYANHTDIFTEFTDSLEIMCEKIIKIKELGKAVKRVKLYRSMLTFSKEILLYNEFQNSEMQGSDKRGHVIPRLAKARGIVRGEPQALLNLAVEFSYLDTIVEHILLGPGEDRLAEYFAKLRGSSVKNDYGLAMFDWLYKRGEFKKMIAISKDNDLNKKVSHALQREEGVSGSHRRPVSEKLTTYFDLYPSGKERMSFVHYLNIEDYTSAFKALCLNQQSQTIIEKRLNMLNLAKITWAAQGKTQSNIQDLREIKSTINFLKLHQMIGFEQYDENDTISGLDWKLSVLEEYRNTVIEQPERPDIDYILQALECLMEDETLGDQKDYQNKYFWDSIFNKDLATFKQCNDGIRMEHEDKLRSTLFMELANPSSNAAGYKPLPHYYTEQTCAGGEVNYKVYLSAISLFEEELNK